MKLSEQVLGMLCCPRCRSRLQRMADHFDCPCGSRYPIVKGIPILINDENSLFKTSDFTDAKETFYRNSGAAVGPSSGWASRPRRLLSGVKRLIVSALPDLGANNRAAQNYARFGKMLLEQTRKPRIVVVGGSIVGRGMACLLEPEFETIATDVAFGDPVQVICDGHDLPFLDSSVDGVVAQAVLEHVLDPWRCADEMHRVLKPTGLVYAESPFVLQVHAGPYDFTRFTHLGHRQVFRRFEEIESGPLSGPGMALAWAYLHFLLSFFTNRRLRSIATISAQVTAFWLKWFDPYLMTRPGAYDSAAAYYFLGRKAERPISGEELIRGYRGAIDLLKQAPGG